jgi:hypothetical protein
MNIQTLMITLNMLCKNYSVSEIGQRIGHEVAVACVTYLLLADPWDQLANFAKLPR